MECIIEIKDLTSDNIIDYGVCGYKDLNKHIELRKKIEWFRKYYPLGLRIKILTINNKYQGMLEYIPGKYAHRPVVAEGYMFIHCIFTSLKAENKGKGYSQLLLEECINEAKEKNMDGVAVVTREGSFMANSNIFLKKGFVVVDKAEPDFELLALKFNKNVTNPVFKDKLMEKLLKYDAGLTILRSPQCPYTEKNVNAIMETAKNKYSLDTRLIDLDDALAAQENPCPFGTFSIIYNGVILSHHPISNSRFENIMKKIEIKT